MFIKLRIVHCQDSLRGKSGIRPLPEAVAEDKDAAVAGNLQVEFNMPMPENIIIVMLADPLLLFGKQHQFLLLLPLIRAGFCQLFAATISRPIVAKRIAPLRRHETEKLLQRTRVEHAAQEHKSLDFLENKRRIECLPIGRHYPVAMSEKDGFAITGNGSRISMNDYSRAAGKPTESPQIMVADKIVYAYSLAGHRLQLV